MYVRVALGLLLAAGVCFAEPSLVNCGDSSDLLACAESLWEQEPSVGHTQRLRHKLLECGLGGRKVPVTLVGDGVCDCCNGADEPREVGCKNTCDREIDEDAKLLNKLLHLIKIGQKEAAQEKIPPADGTRIKRSLQEIAANQGARAKQASEEYEKVAIDFEKARSRRSTPEATLQSLYAQLRQWEEILQTESLRHALANARAEADYGPGDRYLPLLLQRPAYSAPISEKISKGGSTTTNPKTYVYTVTPFNNATQIEYLPDEWLRREAADKGGEPMERQASMTVGTDGSFSNARQLDRSVGPETLLGYFRGFIPLTSVDDFAELTTPMFPNVSSSRTSEQQRAYQVLLSTSLGSGGDLADVVFYYEGLDQCRSEDMVARRRVFVYNVCPGTTAHMLQLALGEAWPRRFSFYRWDAYVESFLRMQMQGRTGFAERSQIIFVAEDGLCAYTLVVTSPHACSMSLKQSAQARIASLKSQQASKSRK